MLHIAICDDQAEDLKLLHSFIERRLAHFGLPVKISGFTSGQALLDSLRKKPCHLVFQDIYLPGTNGLEVARQVKALHETTLVAFTTTSREHALESYQLGVEGYLTKPIEYGSFCVLLDRMLRMIGALQEGGALAVMINRTLRHIPLSELIYLEASRRRSVLHTPREVLETWTTLSELHAQLPEDQFTRCGRSFVINLKWAGELTDTKLTFKNGDHIYIPYREKPALKQAIANYHWRRMREE